MIGVFDSGVGGLSVLTEIRRLMPSADLTYVADRAHAPYGTKALSEVRRLSVEVAQLLVELGATTLVVACNTASAAALETVRSQFPEIAVVGMEPAVKPAAISSASGVIGVFATAATFQGELFETVVSKHASGVRVVTASCPDWVEMVEKGETNGKHVEDSIREVVGPVLESGADTLVLGCTHFSFLGPTISKVVGPSIRVLDPAPAVAAQTTHVASEQGNGSLEFIASGNIEEFENLVDSLTGLERLHPALPFLS
jgi:glutamate racemase